MLSFTAYKDPGADLDYAIDWSAWLGTDTISSSTWTSSSTAVTLHSPSISGGNTAITWVSGGPTGGTHTLLVTNQITTAAGRINERSITFIIQEL